MKHPTSPRLIGLLFSLPLFWLACPPPSPQQEKAQQEGVLVDAPAARENSLDATTAPDTNAKTDAPQESRARDIQPEPTVEPTPEPTIEPQPEPQQDNPRESKAPDTSGPLAYRCPSVTITPPPKGLRLSPFYQKYVNAGGIPLIGSDKVPDKAFAQAYYLIANMLQGKPCIRKALALSGTRVGIIGASEVTTDMPEYSDLNKVFPNVDWNKRARGLGATPVRPLTTGAEENLLQLRNDRYFGENILLHEFAHTIWNVGITALSDGRQHNNTLNALYAEAKSKGLWQKTYAITTRDEYWAETVQSWFNNNLEANPPNGIHNNINTRAELEQYDPKMAALIARFFSPNAWPAYCSHTQGQTWNDPTPSNPTSPSCQLRKSYPPSKSCKDLGTYRSSTDTTQQRLLVVNRSFQTTYQLESIDAQGKRSPQGSLRPRSQRSFSTTKGRYWVLSANGACNGVYQVTHPENEIAVDSP